MTGQPHPSDAAQRVLCGRYRLDRPVGRGGMGTVWLAYDGVLDRPVAVKEVTLPPGGAPAERRGMSERLLREARVAARIDHPNAVRVYDVADDEGHPWVVMELLSGHSLDQAIARQGPLPVDEVARIGIAVLDALDAAHRQGVIHRDVKPGNIQLCDNGRVVLTDFGIATSPGDPAITRTGELLGSPAYMSPERARGQSLGPASDLFSLGATLYAAVEGHPPFDRAEPIATLHAVVSDEPGPMRRAGPLTGLLAALLSKDAAARPDTEDVRAALRAVAGGSGSRPPSDATMTLPVGLAVPSEPERAEPPPVAPARPRRRSRWLVPTLAVLVLTVVAGALIGPRLVGDRAVAPNRVPNSAADGPFDPGQGPVPGDWKRYDSGAGWSIATPVGWQRQAAGSFTRLRNPQRYGYVAIAAQTGAPEATLRSLERQFGPDHDDYRNLGVRPIDFRGSPAAEWQFSYHDGGADLRAAMRGIVVGGRTYLVWFQTKPQDWEGSQITWQAMLASFRAG